MLTFSETVTESKTEGVRTLLEIMDMDMFSETVTVSFTEGVLGLTPLGV